MNHVIPFTGSDAEGWATRIAARWQESVEAIIGTGRLIAEAKAALPHGDFSAMIRECLPFGARTAQRLMQVASDPRLSNPTHASHLPPNWTALYEITRLNDDEFAARLADGTIKPDMERKAVSMAVKATVRATREVLLAAKTMALPDKRFNVIYADPPWRFKPYSDVTGMDRAADNHYPTMTVADIMALPVHEIAARDCALYLWVTAPFMQQAFDVMKAWGDFQYKSHTVWAKDKPGTGYWFINQHEILCVATRGNVPAPTMGTQMRSFINAPVKEHSRKPVIFRTDIERHFPNCPKVELFCRNTGPGWHVWGKEAPEVEQGLDGKDIPVLTQAARKDARLLEDAYADIAGEQLPGHISMPNVDEVEDDSIPDFLIRRPKKVA